MSITTKRGDRGSTRIGTGEELSKSSARVEALGTLDELQSALGVARATTDDKTLSEEIRTLQSKLFDVGGLIADVATCQQAIGEKDIDELSARCATLERKHKHPEQFVVSGETLVAAHLDVARSTARRLERRLVALHESGEFVHDELLTWINRLSDYIWLLARLEETSRKTRTPIYCLNTFR